MNIYTKTIPIFPLSGVLLLPSGNLPLNIFEPKYIAMVNYALKHNKLIGMIQPKPNDSKKLFKVGCVGQITTFSETDDNRYILNKLAEFLPHISESIELENRSIKDLIDKTYRNLLTKMSEII